MYSDLSVYPLWQNFTGDVASPCLMTRNRPGVLHLSGHLCRKLLKFCDGTRAEGPTPAGDSRVLRDFVMLFDRRRCWFSWGAVTLREAITKLPVDPGRSRERADGGIDNWTRQWLDTDQEKWESFTMEFITWFQIMTQVHHFRGAFRSKWQRANFHEPKIWSLTSQLEFKRAFIILLWESWFILPEMYFPFTF